jgi:hypothetical protein
MPSPFPGMDPYLEGHYWSTLHGQLIHEFARQISPQLSPRYVTLTDEWFAISAPDDPSAPMWPDVAIGAVREVATAYDARRISPPTHRVRSPISQRLKQAHLRVFAVEDLRLVTHIELLSPSNKIGEGYEQYLTKRRRVSRRDVNLLEIDLLHRGRRLPSMEPLPESPYLAYLTRSASLSAMDVWAIEIAHSLPTVPIPLLQGDEDATLDIQAAFSSVYEIAPYDRLMKYNRRPPVRLPDDELTWSRDLLASKGIDVTGWDTGEAAP